MNAAPKWTAKLRTWYSECVARAMNLRPNAAFPRFDEIRVDVSVRQSRKAGVCWAGRKRIWLHGAMTEEHALDTFRHELAHLFAFWFESSNEMILANCCDYGHGPVFKKWARVMGDNGERCHNYKEVTETRRGTWRHCPKCRREFKQCFRNGRTYWCRADKTTLVDGRLTPQMVMANIVRRNVTTVAAEVAADATETVSSRIRSLVFELGLLKEGGLASSPEAKKIRVMLRKLDPEWRTNA